MMNRRRCFRSRELAQLMERTTHRHMADCRETMAQHAAELDISPQYLSNMCNNVHGVPGDVLIRHFELTGDIEIPQTFARLMGGMWFPVPQLPTHATSAEVLHKLAEVGKETGEAVCVVARVLADGHLTRHEKAEALREIQEGMHALEQMYQRVNDLPEEPDPEEDSHDA